MNRVLLGALLVCALGSCRDDLRKEVLACDRSHAYAIPVDGSRIEETIKACDDAARIDGLSAKEKTHVYFSRGILLARLDRHELAIRDFGLINGMDDTSPWYPRGMAYVANRRKDNAEALRHHNEAIRRDPKDAVLVGQRGITLFAVENYTDALKDLDVGITPPSGMYLSDQHSALRFKLYKGAALVETKQGQKEAVSLISEWLQGYPQDYYGYIYRGMARLDTGQVNEAIADFDRFSTLQEGRIYLPWLSEKMTTYYNGPFFGPSRLPYEAGVKASLLIIKRMKDENLLLEGPARQDRMNKLFPDRVYANRVFLYDLETGFAPLTLNSKKTEDRLVGSIYYGALLRSLQVSGDRTCDALIRSLDTMSADLAAARSTIDWFGRSQSGWEFFGRLLAIGVVGELVVEQGGKDGILLARQYGCAHRMVINILRNGSTYLSWARELK